MFSRLRQSLHLNITANHRRQIKGAAVLLMIAVFILFQYGSTAWSLSPDQQKIFQEGVNYFDLTTCGTGGTDASTSGSISGNIQDLAKQVLSNSNITFDNGATGPTGTQFKRLADGQQAQTDDGRSVDVEPILLVVILHIAQSHKLQISALTNGSSHTAPTNPHGSGKAVDIDFLDGQGTNGSDAVANQIVSSAAQVLPDGARFGMGNSAQGTKQIGGKTFTVFSDVPNHVHVDVVGVAQSADDQAVQAAGGDTSATPAASDQCACGGSSGSSATTSGSHGAFTIDQVKTFASEPVASTWNISNSTAEQWFLKQAGAQATVAKYGLSSSNIDQITSAVQAAGVSPVFFYLYTVNEGGGAGGFINHYGGDAAGGGPGNATRDAQYLASQSKDKSAGPATGGGEPSDLPTTEAKQILDALPSGSIGVVYIQATSAVTAELEDLSGKTGDWSGLFNKPLSDAMQNIKTMGGDPLQGGATISTGGDCASASSGGGACGGSGKYSALVSSGASFAGVDQGIDFVPSGSGGYNICAPAPGTITLADQTGHHFDRTSGQAEIIEKLDQTPNAPSSSQYIYYAEIIQINSNIKVGAHVNAGDTIGTNSQSPGIEVGWGRSSTEGFMCPIGYPTACGTSFDSWVQGISAGKGP